MAPDIGHPFAEPDPALQAEDEVLSAAEITPASPWWGARTLRRVWFVLLVGFGGGAAFLEYLGPPDDMRTTAEVTAGPTAQEGDPTVPAVVARLPAFQQSGVTEPAASPAPSAGPAPDASPAPGVSSAPGVSPAHGSGQASVSAASIAASIAALSASVPALAPIPRAPASVDIGLPELPPAAVGTASAPVPAPPPSLPTAPSPLAALPDVAQGSGPAAPAPPLRAPVPPPPVARGETIPAALVQTLLRRGDAMMDQGDVSAARRIYERAAAAGSAQAATGVGRSYDPNVLAVLGAPRGMADRAAAIQWYRRGAALGDPEAARLLHEMDAQQDN